MITVIGLSFLVLAAALASRGSDSLLDSAAWEEYGQDGERTVVEKMFGPLSQRFASGPVVRNALKEPGAFESLSRDLRLGNSFGRSLEVYLSVQLVAIIAGMLGVISSFEVSESFPQQRLVLIGAGLIVAYLPYYRVRLQASRKEEQMLTHLPRFADLLTMVLSSLSVPQAIAYAASRDEGPVAEEMSALVGILSSRALPDREAFERAADRMGTTYGRDFVNTLAAAYLEGTTSVDSIRKQTAALRTLQYQSRRSHAKKMPVRMVGVFAIHFLPLLLILSFLPVFSAFSSI